MVEGGRSGTAYASFLSNINKAESSLGLSFTNSQNEMLPIVDIIAKIEGKYGDLSKTADQAILQKAFGKNGQQMLSAMAGSLRSVASMTHAEAIVKEQLGPGGSLVVDGQTITLVNGYPSASSVLSLIEDSASFDSAPTQDGIIVTNGAADSRQCQVMYSNAKTNRSPVVLLTGNACQ